MTEIILYAHVIPNNTKIQYHNGRIDLDELLGSFTEKQNVYSCGNISKDVVYKCLERGHVSYTESH